MVLFLICSFHQSNDDILKRYPPNSFHRIFLKQHRDTLKTMNAKEIIWHPAMIKWCLTLKLFSSSCCNALRSSGLIALPSEKTLSDYTSWTTATTEPLV